MKLKHLLLSVLALIGGVNALAQSYTEGVEVTAGTDYFLMNVGSGKFLVDGMDWGTHATVDNAGRVITFELKDDKYAIKTKTYVNNDNAGYMTDNGYLDTGDAQYWEFVPANLAGYTNAYIIKQADDKILHFNATDCRVNVGTATGDAATWIIVPMSARQAANDYTYLLQNTDFNRPWERFNWAGTAPTAQAGGLETNRVSEMFNKAFDINQTITNVPNGKWKLTCQGFYRAGNKDNSDAVTKNAKLYINTTEVGLMNILEGATTENTTGWDYQNAAGFIPNHLNEVSTHFTNGDFSANEVVAVVANGTLKIGVKKAETIADDWTAFDNFKLQYLGEDLSDYEVAYTAACTAAKAVDVEKPMNKDVKSALETAISTYADKSYSTVAEIQTAITALETVTTNANNSIAHYAAAKSALEAQKALMDGTNVYNAEGFAAYQTAWTTNNTKYENNTLTNEDAVVNPTAKTDWHASTAYNFLLTPWTIGGEACNEFDKALYINTWSEEGNTDGSNFYTPFFEYFATEPGSISDNTIATKVTSLENGLYSVSAWVRVRTAKAEDNVGDVTGISLVAGDGTYAGDEGNGIVDATIGGTAYGRFSLVNVTAYALVKDGNLDISLNVKDANVHWLSFKNVKYTKVRDLKDEEKTVYATPEEIAALKTAIETAEANTIGFEEGEYAPYTNVAAIATLKAAKAINTENPIAQETVVNATTALTNATWTANTEEVNAFYPLSNYNAESEKKSGRYTPLGWSNTTSGGDNYNTRIMVAPDASNAGLTSNALFAKYETSYGEQEGYTMPLKAGVYTLSFKHGGWGEPGARTISLTCGETTVTPSIKTINSGYNDSQSNAEHWATYSCNITIPEAGDYVFNLIKTTNNQNQIVISDLELYTSKEVEANLQITSVGVATFCAPFDVNLNEVEGVEATAYEAVIADNSWVKLNEIESGVIEAGTPVVLKGTPMTEAKILKGVPTATVTKSSCLVGNLGTEKVEVVANAGNYLLQKNDGVLAWYQVKDAGLYIGVNRCYLKFSGDNAREFFPMDFDNPTGIDSIATEAKTKADGKYLVNGKIVVVKAGKVYEVK